MMMREGVVVVVPKREKKHRKSFTEKDLQVAFFRALLFLQVCIYFCKLANNVVCKVVLLLLLLYSEIINNEKLLLRDSSAFQGVMFWFTSATCGGLN